MPVFLLYVSLFLLYLSLDASFCAFLQSELYYKKLCFIVQSELSKWINGLSGYHIRHDVQHNVQYKTLISGYSI